MDRTSVQQQQHHHQHQHHHQVALRRLLVMGMGSAMMHICDLLVAYFKNRKKRMRLRSMACKRRKQFGEFHTLVRETSLTDQESYFHYFRMTPVALEDLLMRVGPRLNKQMTSFCDEQAVSVQHCLCITLRYLATGDSIHYISFSYRVGYSTVSSIIEETCKVIWDVLQPSHLAIPSDSDWRRIAAEFNTLWNFPHCVGALDGKHVVIQAPNDSPAENFNYTGFHSRVLMALCDARHKLTMVDVGAPGKENDIATFQASPFGQKMEDGTLKFLTDAPLFGRADKCPYVIVADETFPLRRYLMRPYKGKQLNLWSQIFNYRLSWARRTIENTFGILANRWRVFRREIIANEGTVDDMIRACCCLHNFVMDSVGHLYNPEGYVDRIDAQGNEIDGRWRAEGSSLTDIRMADGNLAETMPKQIRDVFTMYFMSSEGEVPWQYKHINLDL